MPSDDVPDIFASICLGSDGAADVAMPAMTIGRHLISRDFTFAIEIPKLTGSKRRERGRSSMSPMSATTTVIAIRAGSRVDVSTKALQKAIREPIP